MSDYKRSGDEGGNDRRGSSSYGNNQGRFQDRNKQNNFRGEQRDGGVKKEGEGSSAPSSEGAKRGEGRERSSFSGGQRSGGGFGGNRGGFGGQRSGGFGGQRNGGYGGRDGQRREGGYSRPERSDAPRSENADGAAAVEGGAEGAPKREYTPRTGGNSYGNRDGGQRSGGFGGRDGGRGGDRGGFGGNRDGGRGGDRREGGFGGQRREGGYNRPERSDAPKSEGAEGTAAVEGGAEGSPKREYAPRTGGFGGRDGGRREGGFGGNRDGGRREGGFGGNRDGGQRREGGFGNRDGRSFGRDDNKGATYSTYKADKEDKIYVPPYDAAVLAIKLEDLENINPFLVKKLKDNGITTILDVAKKTGTELTKLPGEIRQNDIENLKKILLSIRVELKPEEVRAEREGYRAPDRGAQNKAKAEPQEDPNAYIIFEKDGKRGLKKGGKIVVEATYTDIFGFKEDLCCVEVDDKYGFINEEGEFIIEAKYDLASSFSEGFACVYKGEFAGYIDKTGETVIPFKYDAATQVKNGSCRVKKDHRWGELTITDPDNVRWIV
jgi:hypothetical protein